MLVVAGCGDRSSRPAARNVLLISIDTCRADHVGVYGAAGDPTPHIDEIAGAGTRFDRAYSPAPITLPSHASMMTGTIPPYHGLHDNGEGRLAAEHVTLAERLHDAGFETAAVVGSFVLDARFGLAQGFDLYDDRVPRSGGAEWIDQRRADEVTDAALAWLSGRGERPFFLFVHYFDPHMLYDPPEPFRTRHADDLYTGEIASVDHQIGRLVDELRERGLDDSTAIVVTADHGEMLGERGEETHTYFIYEPAVRVPLVVRVPGLETIPVVSDPVGLVDVAPTILGLVGLAAPADLDGQDLGPVIRGERQADPDRALYCQALEPTKYGANPLLGSIGRRWKLIETTRPELYDLLADPAESRDLADDQPEVVDRLRRELHARLDDRRRDAGGDPVDDFGGDARRRLRSLGYVGGQAADPTLAIDPDRPDPKDVIGYHARHMRLPYLLSRGALDEAEAEARALEQERPDDWRGPLYLGEVALARGQAEEAVAHLERAIERRPDDADLHHALGRALVAAGDLERALATYGKAVELDPSDPSILANRGVAYRLAGRPSEAADAYRAALTLDPDHLEARYNLANLLFAAGRMDEAVAEYRTARERAPGSPQPAAGLTTALARMGRTEEAVEVLEDAARRFPAIVEFHEQLAIGMLTLRRPEDAVPHFRRAIELAPDNAGAHNNLGTALQQTGQPDAAREAFRTAVHLDPSSASARLNLGASLALAGDVEGAKRELRQALALRPDMENARALLQRLEAGLPSGGSR